MILHSNFIFSSDDLASTVIHRRHTFRVSKVQAQRVIKNASINIIWYTVLVDIIEDSVEPESASDSEDVDLDAALSWVVSGAILRNAYANEEKWLSNIGAISVAIGQTPSTPFLEGLVEIDPDHADTSSMRD